MRSSGFQHSASNNYFTGHFVSGVQEEFELPYNSAREEVTLAGTPIDLNI
jgi:hypothetical protein